MLRSRSRTARPCWRAVFDWRRDRIRSTVGTLSLQLLRSASARLLPARTCERKFGRVKKAPKRARQMCSCGHEIAWHNPDGRCQYGHGTPTGGCNCQRVKTGPQVRKSAGPQVRPERPDVDPALVAIVECLAALHLAVERLAGPELLGPSRVATAAEAPRALPVVLQEKKLERKSGSADVQTSGSADKRTSGQADERLSPCAIAILGVLARAHPKSLTVDYVAIYTGYSQSGSFSGALARLRKDGLIAGNSKALFARLEGLERAGKQIPFPTGEELLEMWSNKLDPCARAVLECLYLRRPAALSAAQIAEEAGYSMSGSFSAALSTLRKLELVHGKGSALSLHDSFGQQGV